MQLYNHACACIYTYMHMTQLYLSCIARSLYL
jgi:hypothetical protein